MSDKECCQAYEIDYEKVVREMGDILYGREQDLRGELKKELNPLKYLELNARLNEVKDFHNTLLELKEYCKKPVEEKQDEKLD
jgi:hypothetical protein